MLRWYSLILLLLRRDVRDDVLEHGEFSLHPTAQWNPSSLTWRGVGVCSPLTLFFPLFPELTVADRRQKREIRQLEQELHKWQVLVDSITGES